MNIFIVKNINFHVAEHVRQDPSIFVDSEYNMIVLCQEHHRSSNRGIHHVPFPEWFLQFAPKDNFVFL
jgi:hypothetical protein